MGTGPDKRHQRLRRQLRRAPAIRDSGDPATLGFLASVDAAYRQADRDLEVVERRVRDSVEALRRSHDELEAVVGTLPDLCFVLDLDGTIRDCRVGDPADLTLPKELLVGRRFQAIPEPEAARVLAAAVDEVALRRERVVAQYWLDRAGERAWFEARLLPLGGERLLALVRNVSEMRRAEETIRFQAFHDPLTGLANRALFHDRLVECIARCRRHGRSLAVLFIDLDRFKRINDTLGHAVGDEVLAEVGRRLLAAKRTEDTMARIGGDEFVHLVSELDRPESAARVAERLLAFFEPPFVVGDEPYHLSASIGIAVFPGDGDDAETLVHNADAALYRAKGRGRAGYCLHTPGFTDRILHRLELETALRTAAERGELRLAYQPIIAAGSGVWTGAEALVRWQREGRLLLPDDFIPAAEDAGLIAAIGDWVLAAACADLAQWRRRGLAPGRVAVNLSVHQLRPPLVERVARTLESTRLEPSDLELEITETALLTSPAEAGAVVAGLRGLGVEIALDDFGTGHSSFQHLKDLPITALKIDRSFVAGCTHDLRDAAIVAAILDLGRGLGLRTVAEGVESLEQADLLRASGCDELQGFYFARPGDASDLDETFAGIQRPTVPAPLPPPAG